MDPTPREAYLLTRFLAPFVALAGDRRTPASLDGIVGGIVASESLVCSRIAAFSPSAGGGCGGCGAGR
jgi:hypothetical protein